jgi:hypothetical protein
MGEWGVAESVTAVRYGFHSVPDTSTTRFLEGLQPFRQYLRVFELGSDAVPLYHLPTSSWSIPHVSLVESAEARLEV